MRKVTLFGAVTLAAVVAAGSADSGPYDSRADGLAQLSVAGQRAASGHKKILAIVGGNW
ncbi:MAG: hypothetical protein ACM3O7_02625 [Acidobacteriota bacterium]